MKISTNQRAHPAPSPSSAAPVAPNPTLTHRDSKLGAPLDAGRAERSLKGERTGEWKSLAERQPTYGSSTDVEALAARYGLAHAELPLQKFLDPLAFIDQAVRSSPDAHRCAEGLLTHDSRREVFRLEALLLVYREDLGPAGTPLLQSVKQLEDHIGAVSSFEHARDVAVAHHAPKVVVDRITALADASREAVAQLLSDTWAPGADGRSRPVQQLVDALSQHDFGSPGHDREGYAQSVEKHIATLRRADLPMNELDTGVHKLRRQLRWIALEFESAGGLVQTVAVAHPNPHFAQVSRATDADRRKQILADGLPPLPAQGRPIEIPEELYFGLQKAIAELGDIKDDVEARTLMQSAYQDAGRSPAEIDRLLGSTGTVADMQRRATVIRDELADAHLLEGLQRALEDARRPHGHGPAR